MNRIVSELTKEKIEETLNPLIGASVAYCARNALNTLGDALESINIELGIKASEGLRVRRSDWQMNIVYKRNVIATVSIKRGFTPDKSHYVYKDFVVKMWPYKPADKTPDEYIDDIDDMVRRVEERIRRQDEIRAANLDKLMTFVKDELGLEDNDEIYKLLNYAANKAYNANWHW